MFDQLGHLTVFDMEITFLCFVCFYEVVAKMAMTFEEASDTIWFAHWPVLPVSILGVPIEKTVLVRERYPSFQFNLRIKMESSAWRGIFHVIQVRDSLDTLLNCIHDSLHDKNDHECDGPPGCRLPRLA